MWGLKGYVEMPSQNPEISKPESDFKLEMTELGKETVDGHPCVKSKATVTDKDGKKYESLVWNATDMKNFPVKIETTAGPRRAPALPLLESDGDRGAMKFLDELGRDHPHDPRMPALGAEDERGIVGMMFGDGDRLRPDALLNALALAVELVECRGQPAGFVAIRSEQEVKCQLRIAQPPGRVQPRRQLEADVACGEGARCDAGHTHQSRNAWSA